MSFPNNNKPRECRILLLQQKNSAKQLSSEAVLFCLSPPIQPLHLKTILAKPSSTEVFFTFCKKYIISTKSNRVYERK